MTDNATKARAFTQQGKEFVEETVTLPLLGPHDVLVEVHYAGFNPTDSNYIIHLQPRQRKRERFLTDHLL